MKKVSTNQVTTGLCTVTAMAEQVGLSRARFYELLAEAVFPPPLYSLRTERPFYTPKQQEECIEIRRRGIGWNGQPVVFNTSRKGINSGQLSSEQCDELTRSLRDLVPGVTKRHVQKALSEVYPKGGLGGVDMEVMIRDLFYYFSRER